MADFTVSVTKNGLVPAVIYAGGEGAAGKTIAFDFSSDWDGFTKEILFFDMRGNVTVTPCVDDADVLIPDDLAMYGGHHKYTIRGFTIDQGYINDSLQVTGTIVTTYTAGHNPRMEGKLLPSTLDLFIAQAEDAMNNIINDMAASGEFDGAPAGFGGIGVGTIGVPYDHDPEVLITTAGPNIAKDFFFQFAIPAGRPGTNGKDGKDGQDGMDFRILGHYNSLQALQAAVPNPERGDAYGIDGIGTPTPFNVYVWDGENWLNFGAIGSNANVDTEMSDSSENAVQNKVIKEYVDDLIGDVDSAIAAINAIVGA